MNTFVVRVISSAFPWPSYADGTTEFRGRYVNARPMIQCIIEQTIRDMPRVLIDPNTGHLYDKERQAEAFKMLPIYSELVSSMTVRLDVTRVRREVETFYRYVMLSRVEYRQVAADSLIMVQIREEVSLADLTNNVCTIEVRWCRPRCNGVILG